MPNNIVSIDFSKPQKIESGPENHGVESEPTPQTSILESLGWDVDQLEKILQNKGTTSSLCAVLAIGATLKKTSGPRSSANAISTHRDGLKEYTLAALHEIAEKSTPDQWQLNPAYYQALVDEIHSRQKYKGP